MLSDDELLTLKELAGYLKLKPRTISIKLRRGELPGFKLLTKWRVRKSKIDLWLRERAETKEENQITKIQTTQQRIESQS